MESVIFVPGIMGTALSTPDGQEVWPPTAWETQFGYRRKADLMRDDLVAGDVIRNVLCFDFYRPLIRQLSEIGFPEDGADKKLTIFPYDWRLDLETTAGKLAETIAKRHDEGATSITLIAHSMGGLISRLVLESGKYDAEPWFGKIGSFLALATPHLGAPLALARVLGLDSTLGISAADFRDLANDPRYPSGYQLLPAPGEAACWNIASETLDPLDIYDPQVSAALGLNPALLERARYVHDTLGRGAAPAHVRYFYFAGTGHKTATRINFGHGEPKITVSDDAGDGTVPVWSAFPRLGQKQAVVGEHASFFTATAFKPVFYRLLGAASPTPPLGVAPAVDLSVHAISLKKSETIELLLVPPSPTGEISGTIALMRTDDPATPFAPFGPPVTVAYKGPAVPQLRLILEPAGQPGLFQAAFTGLPGNSPAVQFAVTDQ
ncbi:hypothetical protein ACFFJ7_14160 [Pseudochelatococcus lubricantis]|uniref:lipase/acyltransferase domain-containing protein n=1 Tax=Pseudochelatococcus lubricantis TaxID=1538102 RepID=UPI0035E7A217